MTTTFNSRTQVFNNSCDQVPYVGSIVIRKLDKIKKDEKEERVNVDNFFRDCVCYILML